MILRVYAIDSGDARLRMVTACFGERGGDEQDCDREREPPQLLFQGKRVKPALVRNGFITAGVMNIAGVLLFSRLFTNTAINEADPVVMSNFGLVMIVVWGLAYFGAATIGASVKWLAAAFALEKLIYVLVWAMWHSKNSVSALFTTDLFAGVFLSIYGLNDLLFMVFFASVFYLQSRPRDL